MPGLAARLQEMMTEIASPIAFVRSHREITAAGLLCLGLWSSACAAGTDLGQDWTGGAGAKADSESEAESDESGKTSSEPSTAQSDSRDSASGTEKTPNSSTGEEPSGGGAVSSESTETSPEPGDSPSSGTTSSTSSITNTSSSAPEPSTSASTSTASSEEGSTGATGQPACEIELCAFLNHRERAGRRTWRPARHRFSFVAPTPSRRLARIELMEGMGRGRTRVEVRSDDGDSSGNLLSRVSWDFDLPTRKEWRGANLARPKEMPAGRRLWVTVEPTPYALASIAAEGESIPLWYEAGSQRWVKKNAALMYRIFCCK